MSGGGCTWRRSSRSLCGDGRLWARSFWRKDRAGCAAGRSLHVLASRHGRIGYQIERVAPDDPVELPWDLGFSSAPADGILFSGIVGDIDSAGSLEVEPAVDVAGIALSPAVDLSFVPH